MDDLALQREEKTPILQAMGAVCAGQGFAGGDFFLNDAVLAWLVQEEICTVTPGGCRYIPTAKGASLGFFAEKERIGIGPLCNAPARDFLRNNLDRIIAFERKQWDPLLACLTPEWYRRVPVGPEPAALSRLMQRINDRLPDNLPRILHTKSVSAWAVRRGLLEAAGRKTRPTRMGEEIGIRAGHPKLWTVPAQQFILDRLEEIVRDAASGEAYRRETPASGR